ncbi:MAG TPA: NTP transferase domain-containing protein [Rubrivivax sp.]|nr:NTP transferase domain-containing protein [Burkholderiales bacterium]HNT39651.1 NTP transferase domain-containing protein [Rubrivivax sp.]
MRPQPPSRRAVVLLAAGSGRRMLPLTEEVPKALLPIEGEGRGRTVLEAMIDSVMSSGARDIVVVTGFAGERVESHLARRYGDRVRCVRNTRWAEDVNIASVSCGVGALRQPERGYLVVETDLLLDRVAWSALFDVIDTDPGSFWVCRGRYGVERTGGVVHAGADERIDVVDYRPTYDPNCEGWPKMLGMLAVGPAQVRADIALRAMAMQESIRQYYLMPWKHGLHRLCARVLALEVGFAATFNTVPEFEAACRAYQVRAERAVALSF